MLMDKSYHAVYTSTGMHFYPYVAKDLKRILNARSVYVSPIHKMDPVTAYVMKDPTYGKVLVTYKCGAEWLRETCPRYQIENMPKNHVAKIESNFHLNLDIIPNEIQSSAIQAVIENDFDTAFFNIPTGIGKTLMAIYLTSLLGVKGWAMCYRVIVLEQWAQTMTEKTSMDFSRCKIISSSKELLKMADGLYPYENYDFYMSTPQILVSFAERYGIMKLNDVFDACGIGVKFYDEAHRNVGNITKINGLTNVPKTYYLSADFKQGNPEKEALYYKMFGRIPVIRPTREYGLTHRYTVGIMIRYNTHPGFAQIESCFTKYGFNKFNYMEYQLMNNEFYRVLREVLRSIHNIDHGQGYRTLILCNLIRHVDDLTKQVQKIINEIYRDQEIPHVGRYHSMMPEDEKKDVYENADIIVSTYQSMGVGVDLKMLRYVLSLSPMNVIDDNQAAGRARALPDGKDTYYMMFVDDGFAYVTNRIETRTDYLQEQKLKALTSIQYS